MAGIGFTDLPAALILVGFLEIQYQRRISAAKIGYFLRHARVSFQGFDVVRVRTMWWVCVPRHAAPPRV